MKLQLPWYQAKMKNIFPLLLASNEGTTTGGLWQKGLPNVLLGSWQQLVRESPVFSSVSIETEETRLGRVYINGVSVAPPTTWQNVIPPNISIRTGLAEVTALVGWLAIYFCWALARVCARTIWRLLSIPLSISGRKSVLAKELLRWNFNIFFRSILLLKWRTVIEKADVTTSRIPRATDLPWCGHW